MKKNLALFGLLVPLMACMENGDVIPMQQVNSDPGRNDPAMMGAKPGTIRLFHVKGEHVCWSSKTIGYKCDVETFNGLNCQHGAQLLQSQNCCNKHTYQGAILMDGRSSSFTVKGCSAVH